MPTEDNAIHDGSTARIQFILDKKDPVTGALTRVTDANPANIQVYNAEGASIANKNLADPGPGNLTDHVVNEGNGVYATYVTVGSPGRYRAVGRFTVPGGIQANMPKKFTVHPLT